MSCGGYTGSGYTSTCYSFQRNNWTKTGAFTNTFKYHNPVAVAMSTGTFVLGKPRSQLWRKGSNKWEEGPEPHPDGTFYRGCVAKIDEDNLLVMGGSGYGKKYGKKVFKYNVQDMTWTPMPDMMTARSVHACALFKDKSASYVLVAGGYSGKWLASTEMYFLNGTVKEGNPMTKKRGHFKMMFMAAPTAKIYAIGGSDGKSRYHDSVEMWDNTKTWEMTSIKMKTPLRKFGAVAVPEESTMPKIECQE